MVKYGDTCTKAAKDVFSETKSPLCSYLLLLLLEGMVPVPASQPGSASLLEEKKSLKFVNTSEKGHPFSKKPGGMLLLKSSKTTQQEGRLLEWKASSKVSMSVLLKLHTPCGGGGSLVRGNIGPRYVL